MRLAISILAVVCTRINGLPPVKPLRYACRALGNHTVQSMWVEALVDRQSLRPNGQTLRVRAIEYTCKPENGKIMCFGV